MLYGIKLSYSADRAAPIHPEGGEAKREGVNTLKLSSHYMYKEVSDIHLRHSRRTVLRATWAARAQLREPRHPTRDD